MFYPQPTHPSLIRQFIIPAPPPLFVCGPLPAFVRSSASECEFDSMLLFVKREEGALIAWEGGRHRSLRMN